MRVAASLPDPRRCGGSANGFSLIELLIVIAIILIIAAIAIPNLMRSRRAANETTAIQNLRTITTAQITYAATYANGYAPDLNTLSGAGPVNCSAAQLIDSVLATGQKSGYTFPYVGASPNGAPVPGCAAAGFNQYTLRANPLLPGASGDRYFYTDETAVIRQNLAAPAGPGSPPIQ